MKNKLISIVIVCLIVIGGFIGFVNFESENAQGTPVSGPITIDTIWDLAGSPYIVIGDVIVASGVTLTIEAGVEVKFDVFCSISVDGTLIAIGTETDRIKISSNKAVPSLSDWNDILINSNGHTEIKYCDISYANNGINLFLSSPISNNNIITNSSLTNNKCGIYIFSSSNNIINDNAFSNNSFGLELRSSSNNIFTNNILLNNDCGIDIYASSNNILINNTFINEGVYIWGDQPSHFNTHTIPDDNMVNGKPLYYYKNQSGINIDGIPVGQLILSNCTNVDVKNIQINNTDVGIVAAYSTNITIENNIVSLNDNGMYFYESTNNIITNNTLSFNQDESHGYFWCIGVHLSSNNTITNNNVSNNEGGIYLMVSSNNNTIDKNYISSNSIHGIVLGASSNNNIVKGNIVATNSGYGMYLQDSSSNNSITHNEVSNNDMGMILLTSANNNTVSDNNFFSNNVYGIGIGDSSNNNNITGNIIFATNDYGIAVSSSSNNKITYNNVSMTKGYGIYLETSSINRIYHNIILNNAIQAFDDMSNNIWNDTYPLGGNYWSDFDEPGDGAYDDYQGTFQTILGSDGIVDNGTVGGGGMNPYIIDSDSMDYYPLLRDYLFLHEGWNLISIPLVQSDKNLDTVLSSISGSYDAVQYYNLSDSPDPWKHNHIPKPPLWNDLKDIDHKIGLWIHITKPGGVIFECPGVRPIANQTINLHPGWNLVGYPSLSSKVRMEALNNINFGSDVDAIWTYNTTGSEWEEMTKVDYFERGRGYWIHSKVDKTWIVPL